MHLTEGARLYERVHEVETGVNQQNSESIDIAFHRIWVSDSIDGLPPPFCFASPNSKAGDDDRE